MPRYFIQLAYNGANYNGWQSQHNTQKTIQQTLQDSMSLIFGQPIKLVGCGRTDTGVHAKDYFAHFDSTLLDLHLNDNYVYKLNKLTPSDLSIKNIILVNEDSNARFDAESRTYEYFIHRYKSPFLHDRSLYIFGELNIDLMNEAASYLLTVNDFTSFSKTNTQVKSNQCTVTFAQWVKLNDSEYVFKITANRFLRNMVRAIVGTLLDIGKEKITIETFKNIIASKNRSQAGMSVPAHALYLSHVQYPSHLIHES
jgi:tRNA pseudouridine38-40 synthase